MPHLVPSGGEGFHTVRRQAHDLLGAQLIAGLIPQLLVGEGFEGDTVAVLVFPYQHREPAQLVPGGDDAVRGQQQDGHGAVDDLLGVADALHQGILLVDESSSQLGGVDETVALGHELMARIGEVGLHQFLSVIDDAHRGDGVQPQVGTHQQRLRIHIRDAADAAVSMEIQVISNFVRNGVFSML